MRPAKDLCSDCGLCDSRWVAYVRQACAFLHQDFEGMERRRKRAGHLFSKMRYVSAQLLAMLDDDLWLDGELRLRRAFTIRGRELPLGVATFSLPEKSVSVETRETAEKATTDG